MLSVLNNKLNMNKNFLFTSESVSEGHPDKVCDIISDAVVDDFLSQENPENARVAMETLVTTNKVVMAGEVRGPENYKCDYESLARKAVKEIGYEQDGFHWEKFSLIAQEFIVNPLILLWELMHQVTKTRVLAIKE